MSGTRHHLRRRRTALYHQQGGKCHWCGCEMILLDPAPCIGQPTNLATVDHLYDRLDPRRQIPPSGPEQRWVAACRECNHKRGRESQSAQPIEDLRRRSGSVTAADRWGGAVTFDRAPATFKLGELLSALPAIPPRLSEDEGR